MLVPLPDWQVRLNSKRRHSGRDCRNPVAMEGRLDSPPCVLDTGNPCRYDGLTQQYCSGNAKHQLGKVIGTPVGTPSTSLAK